MARQAQLVGKVAITDPDTGAKSFESTVDSVFRTVNKENAGKVAYDAGAANQALPFGALTTASFVYLNSDKSLTIDTINGTTVSISNVYTLMIRGTITGVTMDIGGEATEVEFLIGGS